MPKLCCDKLDEAVGTPPVLVGGIGVYPPSMRSQGQIEQDNDGEWNVPGCCGGGCYVLTDIKFCPFCGTALPKEII